MARAHSDSTKVSVPYVPFPTFCTALDYLKTHGIPAKIDASVFPTLSGGIVSHLLISLRLLGVIDEKGDPQPPLQPILAQLVEDKTRKQTLAQILPKAYAALFSKIELATASPAQLDNALRENNVRGATLRKAKAFLIKSAQFAGLGVSAHLVKRTRSSGPRGNGSRKAKQFIEVGNAQTQVRKEPQYSKILSLPQARCTLTLSGDIDPFSLRGAERELFYKLVDLMTEFESKKESADE